MSDTTEPDSTVDPPETVDASGDVGLSKPEEGKQSAQFAEKPDSKHGASAGDPADPEGQAEDAATPAPFEAGEKPTAAEATDGGPEDHGEDNAKSEAAMEEEHEEEDDEGEDEQEETSAEPSGARDLSKTRDVSDRRNQESAELRLHRIGAKTLERIEAVFEEPESCAKFRDEQRIDGKVVPQHRIILINGPPRTGRFSCAMQLGLWLLEEKRRRACFRYEPQNPTLEEVISKVPNFEHSAVYIVRNIVQQGFRIESFTREYLDLLNTRLERNDAHLVLTCSLDDDQPLRDLAGSLHPVQLQADYSPEFTAKVIRKHVKYYTPGLDDSMGDDELWQQLGEALEQASADLGKLLRNPVQVSTFFLRLSQFGLQRDDQEDVHNALSRLAAEVTQSDRLAVKRWFRDLSPNAKLYAMLIRLFEGLNGHAVHALYRSALSELSKFDIDEFHDDRQDGLEQLFEQIHVIAKENGDLLEFAPQVYESEVDRQIESYRHMLWSVMTTTVYDWIEWYRGPEYWQLRLRLGRAIGRLGIHDWHQLQDLLTDLAQHAHGSIASVPGYALQVVMERGGPNADPGKLKQVNELLRGWVESGDPDLMWATAAAIWRFYDTIVAAAEREQCELGGFLEFRPEEKPDDGRPFARALFETEEVLQQLAVNHFDFSEKAIHDIVGNPEQRGYHSDLDPEAMRDQWAGDNVNGIVWAAREMFRMRPKRAVALACRWMSSLDHWHQEHEAKETASGDDDHDDEEEDAGDRKRQQELGEEFDRRCLLQQFGARIGAELLLGHDDEELLHDQSHEPLLQLVLPVLHLAADLYDPNDELADSYGIYQQTVDSLLKVLRNWLKNERWTDRVYRTLLRALNRSSTHQRRRITRNLLNEWMKEADHNLYQTATSLLARALIIDGCPMDLPGKHYGVLLIDGSQMARRHKTPIDVGYHLYERLRTQTDLYVGYLGKCQWIACPDGQAEESEFRQARNLPRLLMPLLESLEPNDTHFVLIITYEWPLDVDDAFDDGERAVWSERLIGRRTGEQLFEYDDELFRAIFRNIERFNTEKDREGICSAVDNRLETSLAVRSADQWWQLLQPQLPRPITPAPQAVATALREFSERLDDIPDSEQCDVARLIGCGLQWLAAADMTRTVEVLLEWIDAAEDAPQVPLGLSYSRMLLRILAQHPGGAGRIKDDAEEVSTTDIWGFPLKDTGAAKDTVNTNGRGQNPGGAVLPSVVTHGRLLDLGPKLAAKEDWHSVREMLHWVRRWINDESWASHFNRSCKLYETMDACPASWREVLQNYLIGWSKIRGHWQEKETPAAAHRLGQSLLVHLWLGKRKPLPALPDRHSYLVILLDPHQPHLAKIARRIAWRFQRKSRFPNLQTVVHRLGQLDPVAVPGDQPSMETLLPEGLPSYARLASPILDSLPRDRIRSVLLLANRPPLDLEDFADDWLFEGRFYYGRGKLPPDWAPPWELIPRERSDKRAADQIVHSVRHLLKGDEG